MLIHILAYLTVYLWFVKFSSNNVVDGTRSKLWGSLGLKEKGGYYGYRYAEVNGT